MTANTVLAEYANPLNWDTDSNGIRRIWREPGSSTPATYNGFELARAALSAAQPHVQIPPENEHVGCDVSKTPEKVDTPQPTPGWVMIPCELAERVQETLGEFLMDHGWRQQDMDTSDEFGALLAVAPKVGPVQQPAPRPRKDQPMTDEEIKQLAMEASGAEINGYRYGEKGREPLYGIPVEDDDGIGYRPFEIPIWLSRFAAMVSAKERETGAGTGCGIQPAQKEQSND